MRAIFVFVQCSLLSYARVSYTLPFTGFESGLKGGKPMPQTPFRSYCAVYEIGDATRFMPFGDGSKLAFFPLTEYDTTLLLNIYMPGRLYKVTIRGSSLTLEKCRPSGAACEMEEEAGVKITPYVKPYEWNEISAVVNRYTNKISIKVGDREVMSMPIHEITHLIRGATWAVAMPDKNLDPTIAKPVLYMVQFKCPELSGRVPTDFGTNSTPSVFPHLPADTHHSTPHDHRTTERPSYHSSPAHHIEHTTEKPSMRRSELVGLVVGIAIGVLILVGLTVFVYRMIKKKQSMDVTEKSNLKDQKQDKKGVSNQAMQE